MVARALGWLKSAGSWIVAAVVAVPVLAWLWQAYRRERDARIDAEGRAAHAVDALATAIEAGRARATALARAERELSEIHIAASRDKGRLMAFHAELEAVAGPERAAAVWDRVFDRTPSGPGDESRERWVAP